MGREAARRRSDEQEHARSRPGEPLAISDTDRAGLQALGEKSAANLARPHTSAAERKRILRFIIREVVLDQKTNTRRPVWLKIIWQTEATSEHHLQRRRFTPTATTSTSTDCRQRITGTQCRRKMDKEIARDTESGRLSLQPAAVSFRGENIWLLRSRWHVPTVKINGVDANPMWLARRQLLVQGAAAELGITPQTVSTILRAGC